MNRGSWGVLVVLAAGCAGAERVVAEPSCVSVGLCPASPRAPLTAATEACERGDYGGCRQVALRLLTDAQTPGEQISARLILETACDRGDGPACAHLGAIALLGLGAPADPETGERLLQEACDRYPGAACAIAVDALMGQAAAKAQPPPDEVALFADRGCAAGDGTSCRLAGDEFRLRGGERAGLSRALEAYRRSCVSGDGGGCSDAALMLLSFEPQRNAAEAEELFTRACGLGSKDGCRNRVVMALRGMPSEPERRRKIFEDGCDRGVALGCAALLEVPIPASTDALDDLRAGAPGEGARGTTKTVETP